MLKFKRAVNFLFDCEFKVIVFLSVFIILGLVLGSYYGASFNTEQGDNGSFLFSAGYLNIFFKTVSLLFVSFLLGYTVIGTPLIFLVLLYWGACCGVVNTAAIKHLGFGDGLAFVLLGSVYFVLTFVSLLLISFSSVRLSLALFGVFRSDTRYVSPKVYSNPHIIKFLGFLFVDAFSCVYFYYFIRPLIGALI